MAQKVRLKPEGEKCHAIRSVSLYPSLEQKVEAYADRHGMNFSEVIRTALRLLLLEEGIE